MHCLIARELWNLVFSLFGVQWVMPSGVVDLLASWSHKFNRHRATAIWAMISLCLMWGIWRERNACTFDGDERSIQDLKRLFLQTLEWKILGLFIFDSLADLIYFCNFQKL